MIHGWEESSLVEGALLRREIVNDDDGDDDCYDGNDRYDNNCEDEEVDGDHPKKPTDQASIVKEGNCQ